MPRIKRIEEANYPYHIIQRGNRRQRVFLRETDNDLYLKILRVHAQFYGLEIWAYCLMVNHVHLIVVPRVKDTLTVCIGEVHRQYTRMINFREGWRGHLWQGRFKSFPLDERYLFAALRYVERNPVRAKMVYKAEEHLYSSARAHIKKLEDKTLTHFYLLDRIKDWGIFLQESEKDKEFQDLRVNQETGRSLGDDNFIKDLEGLTGQELMIKKPGPKIK